MKILVANRGEIAARILTTLREQNIASVAVYSPNDAEAPHSFMADEALRLTGPTPYLDQDELLACARKVGATAIHPGYGFLSQNPGFAEACGAAGITFIGPSPRAMAALGDKRAAREVALGQGVPVVPGAAACDTPQAALSEAQRVGFPVLLKAAAGGGGKGMRKVETPEDMPEMFAAAQREAQNAFHDGRLLLEKLITPARHVEVQIMGDGSQVVALGERECSLQRRYQKIVEESPSPGLPEAVRPKMLAAAERVARAVGYSNAGTVEFLLGPDGDFYFLEVNTRLQVEHPVTEARYGLDLVALQVHLAHGGALPALPEPRGHAIEARLNAEDAYQGFLPAIGRVHGLRWPQRPNLRIDAGIASGSLVTPDYDPLLAKLIVWAPERELARRRLIAALCETTLLGLTTNQTFLIEVLKSHAFCTGATFTTTIEDTTWSAPKLTDALLAHALTAAPKTPEGADKPHLDPWDDRGGFRMDGRVANV